MGALMRHFMGLFIPWAVAILAVAGVVLFAQGRENLADLRAHEMLNVGLGSSALTGEIQAAVRDLEYLANHVTLHVDWSDPNPERIAHLEKDLIVFASAKRAYDQVRLIDGRGMEMIRVNFDAGRTVAVPREDLQDKSGRYYFVDAFALAPGEVFVSPLDLNIEHGAIETPFKPMIRVGTPVVDPEGRKRGIVLLNVFGRRLLDSFIAATMNISDHAMLLDAEGYWLRSPDPADEWGFMLDRDTTLARRAPAAWRRIAAADRGQFLDGDGLWSFETIRPLVEGQRSSSGSARAFGSSRARLAAGQYVWKSVSHVARRALLDRVAASTRTIGFVAFGLIGVAFVWAWWGATNQQARFTAERARRESETREGAILASSLDAIVGLDADGAVTAFNPSAEILFGLEEAAALGRRIEDLVEVDGEAPFSPRLLAGRRIEATARRGDGTALPVEVAVTGFRQGGRMLHTAFLRDISERRRAERVARDHQLDLERAVRQRTHDLGERIKEMTALYSMARLFNGAEGSSGEILARAVELIPPAYQYPRVTRARIILDGDEVASRNFVETPWRQAADIFLEGRIAGRIEVFYTEAMPDCDEGPFLREEHALLESLAANIGQFVDRHRAQTALAESRDWIALLLSSVAEAIFTLDPEGRCTLVNPACLRMLGHATESELLGRDMHETIHHSRPDGSPHAREACAIFDAFRHGEGAHADSEVLWRKDGTCFPAEYWSFPIRRDGTVVGAVVTFLDITERRAAEKALAEKTASLESSNADLQQFAYVASHDLREPLRMVSLYLSLLERKFGGDLDEAAREYIAIAIDGAKRMDVMIRDLLEYSRVGTDGTALARTDADEVLDEVLANLAAAIGERSAVIARQPLPMVMADRSQLLRLLQNLIANALKYRPADRPPEIRIDASIGADRMATFAVRDNGIGIDPEYFERIFVIFQRLHGREEFGGTGIGLAVCKRIVERHGGRIWVESTPGEGSTFRFTLPTART